MDKELIKKLEKTGLTSVKNELMSKAKQAERELVLHALVQKAKKISFSLESTQARSVITALSVFTTIPNSASAERALEHYSKLSGREQLEFREQIYAQFIRQSTMFNKIIEKN
ncbi:hypothetical protein [Vibrio hepatarius]|uniref:hypothetical protein n=1 Tax=Vibrio hepatarius TaxID=171383 RepID=UPI001C088BFE|nr:hypothetical protein [Vibrio hepatarius]MBU2899034.1 hypothetical protein [Vibrio hepatarius]